MKSTWMISGRLFATKAPLLPHQWTIFCSLSLSSYVTKRLVDIASGVSDVRDARSRPLSDLACLRSHDDNHDDFEPGVPGGARKGLQQRRRPDGSGIIPGC